jgi:hypothetical protein
MLEAQGETGGDGFGGIVIQKARTQSNEINRKTSQKKGRRPKVNNPLPGPSTMPGPGGRGAGKIFL